jgi:small-conductance mechanosensitive channel/CRP-like cAMP-binding protein
MRQQKLLTRGSAATIAFLGFVALGLFDDKLLGAIGSEALARSKQAFVYTVQIGIWLSGAAFLSHAINLVIWDRLVARATGRPVPRLIKDFFTAIIFLIAITGIVGVVFGQSVVGIWATSGALGVVLGFALKSMIADVFTGLALNVDRAFALGDWIELRHRDTGDRIYGKVRDINWRTTRIELENRTIAVIPNSMMGTVGITNHSAPDSLARQELVLTLDFSVSPQRAMRVLLAGAKAVAGEGGVVETPAPQVLIKELSTLGTVYAVRYFVDLHQTSVSPARHLIHRSVLDQLHQAGITPAYPKQDQFTAPMPVRHLDFRSESDRVTLLRNIDLFGQSLGEVELVQLAGAMRERNYAAGAELMRQGETDHSMFILAEGLVEVTVSMDGKPDLRVAKLVPGECFGEMALLTGEPRSATITAATETVAFEVTKSDMTMLLVARPAIAETISTLIAERKIGTIQALQNASMAEREEASRSLSEQILGRIKGFFRNVFSPAEATKAAAVH